MRVQVNRRALLRYGLRGAAFAVGAVLSAGLRPRRSLAAARGTREAASDNVVLQRNAAALQAVREAKPGSPMVARALAMLHTCMYDAWAAYDPLATGTMLGGALRRPAGEQTPANKQAAVSMAAYRALVDLFPGSAAMFVRLLESLGYGAGDVSTDTSTPTGVGSVCAGALLDWRHHDGSNQLGDLHPGGYSDYTGYQPINTPDEIIDPNRWQPLRVFDGQSGFVVQRYIGPQWGLVTPFALRTAGEFRPGGPATYPSDAYRVQAAGLLDYSANLTDEQKVITEYFADGPASELPPGHWCLFAQFVSRRDGHDLDADLKLFFILTNALMDAGIAAWEAKRVFDSERPITAVHFLYRGQQIRAWGGPYQGTQLIDGGNWQLYQSPVVLTPAFPEYVSGHSTFSAAAAEILRRFTGSDAFGASYTQAAGSSRLEPGAVPAADLTLTWPTFSAAAEQAGLSRRYGGIHFADGDLHGRAMGRLIGARVWERAQAYLAGAATAAGSGVPFNVASTTATKSGVGGSANASAGTVAIHKAP